MTLANQPEQVRLRDPQGTVQAGTPLTTEIDTCIDCALDVRVAATGQALIAAQHQVVGGVTRLYTYALGSGALRLRLDAPELGYNFPTHYHAIAPTNAGLGIVRSRASDGAIFDHIPVPMLITLLRVSPDGSTLVAVESYSYGPARIGLVNLRQLH